MHSAPSQLLPQHGHSSGQLTQDGPERMGLAQDTWLSRGGCGSPTQAPSPSPVLPHGEEAGAYQCPQSQSSRNSHPGHSQPGTLRPHCAKALAEPSLLNEAIGTQNEDFLGI